LDNSPKLGRERESSGELGSEEEDATFQTLEPIK
jgi:hypothetical protein